MAGLQTVPDVLTLEEAARYLRLSGETIERQALEGRIPGRKIEDSWRFLRAAIDEWLRSHDGRSIALEQFAALRDDETLAQLRATVYAARGRPEASPDDVR
jgi:excisionase family DNA binding protein